MGAQISANSLQDKEKFTSAKGILSKIIGNL